MFSGTYNINEVYSCAGYQATETIKRKKKTRWYDTEGTSDMIQRMCLEGHSKESCADISADIIERIGTRNNKEKKPPIIVIDSVSPKIT